MLINNIELLLFKNKYKDPTQRGDDKIGLVVTPKFSGSP